MFGRDSRAPHDTVPLAVYEAERARGDRLEADVRLLTRQLVDAQKHAPRGETGRTPKAVPAPAPVPIPGVPTPASVGLDAPDLLTAPVLAVAERYAFGDDAQRRRNLREAAAWRAAGVDEAEVIARIAQGSYVDPDDIP